MNAVLTKGPKAMVKCAMMLSFKQKLCLTALYAKSFLTVSETVSLSSFIAVAAMDADKSETASVAVMLSLVKLFLTGILVLLKRLDRGGSDRGFFYINLGLYPSRMMVAAALLDLAVYVVVLTLIIVIKNALLY